MNYDDLPEWFLPYFDNFTGPFWSDGKLQGSTSRPKKKPLTKLDWHSRSHDSEYALCDSLQCLDNADLDYYRSTRNMSLGPQVIGSLPLIGNKPLREVYKLFRVGYKGSEVHLRKKMGASDSDLRVQQNPDGSTYTFDSNNKLVSSTDPVAKTSAANKATNFRPVSDPDPTVDVTPTVRQPIETTVGSTPVTIDSSQPQVGTTSLYDPMVQKRGSIDISGNGMEYTGSVHMFHNNHPYNLNIFKNGKIYYKNMYRKKKKKIYVAY